MANGAHKASGRANCKLDEVDQEGGGLASYLFATKRVPALSELAYDYCAYAETRDEFYDHALNPMCTCCPVPRRLMNLKTHLPT